LSSLHTAKLPQATRVNQVRRSNCRFFCIEHLQSSRQGDCHAHVLGGKLSGLSLVIRRKSISLDFLNTDQTGVIYFERATSNITAAMNCEHERIENSSVLRIKRTIFKTLCSQDAIRHL
jgi:hypothetical protein